jgi:hypothetical protein
VAAAVPVAGGLARLAGRLGGGGGGAGGAAAASGAARGNGKNGYPTNRAIFRLHKYVYKINASWFRLSHFLTF